MSLWSKFRQTGEEKKFQFCFWWTLVCLTLNLALLVTSLMHLAPGLRLLIDLKWPKQRYWRKVGPFFGTSNNYAFAHITESSTNDENDSTREWVFETCDNWALWRPLTWQPKTTSKKPRFWFQGSLASYNVNCFNNDIFRKFAFWFPGIFHFSAPTMNVLI